MSHSPRRETFNGGIYHHQEHYRRRRYCHLGEVRHPDSPQSKFRFFFYGFCGVSLAAVLGIGIYLSLRFSSIDSSSEGGGVYYAPYDSHMVSLSHDFCKQLKTSIHDGVPGYNATAFLLNSHPVLAGKNFFSFVDQPDFSSSIYQYYYFYLYARSSFNVSACYTDDDGRSVTFYLIQGSASYNNFRSNSKNLRRLNIRKQFSVKNHCSTGNTTYSYTVTSNDYYYLIFYKGSSFSSMFNVSMSFHRMLYDFNPDSIIDSCNSTTDSKSCSIDIPLAGSSVFLLVLFHPNSDNVRINWANDKADIFATCTPRVWLYILVAIAVTVGTAVILVLSGLICISVAKFQKRKLYQTLPSDDQSITSDKVERQSSLHKSMQS